MATAISGKSGSGSVTVYTLAQTQSFRLDAIFFQLVADGSGAGHSPEVLLLAPNGSVFSRIPDWNDVADGLTVQYTFGIGLTPFCGVTNAGGAVQNDLPETVLEPACAIIVRSVNSTGGVVSGDAISSVVLWVEDVGAAAPVSDAIPWYTPVPLDEPVPATAGATA